MATNPDKERVLMHVDNPDALDLFPSEQELTPPEPAKAPLIPASSSRPFAPILEMPDAAGDPVPMLDGALEPESMPPFAIATAAVATVLFVLLGVAVFFQRQRLQDPQIDAAAQPAVEAVTEAEKQAPLATIAIADVKIPSDSGAPRLDTLPAKIATPAALKTMSPPAAARPTATRAVNPPPARTDRQVDAPVTGPISPFLDLAPVRTAPLTSDAPRVDAGTLRAAEPTSSRTPAAEPPVAAAPPPPAEPPAPSSSELIRGVLQQYAIALSRLDVDLTRKVWPSADPSQLRRAYGQLASQQIDLGSCDVKSGELNGSAVCAGRVTIVPRVGRRAEMSESRTWIFDVTKRDGRWIIVGVKGQ